MLFQCKELPKLDFNILPMIYESSATGYTVCNDYTLIDAAARIKVGKYNSFWECLILRPNSSLVNYGGTISDYLSIID